MELVIATAVILPIAIGGAFHVAGPRAVPAPPEASAGPAR